MYDNDTDTLQGCVLSMSRSHTVFGLSDRDLLLQRVSAFCFPLSSGNGKFFRIWDYDVGSEKHAVL